MCSSFPKEYFLSNNRAFFEAGIVMKTMFVAMLCILAGRASVQAAAPAPAEFAGVTWGSSVEGVKASMAGREVKLDERDTTLDKLVYEGGVFANFKANFWGFYFVNGKFYRGRVRIVAEGAPEQQVRTFVRLLTEKYGPPTQQQASGKGHVNSRDRKGTFWVLKSALDHRDVVIECFVFEHSCVVQYTDESSRPEGDKSEL